MPQRVDRRKALSTKFDRLQSPVYHTERPLMQWRCVRRAGPSVTADAVLV